MKSKKFQKNSIFAKTAALIMAAVVCIMSSGCGVKGQTADGLGTQPAVIGDGSQAAGEDGGKSSGMGRYVEKTVHEGEFTAKVCKQILDDGRIVFLDGLSGQKFVSKDGGVTWEAEKDDGLAAFCEEHYPASTAVAKDGTVAIIGMDMEDIDETKETSEIADLNYTYNLYIYNTDGTTGQIKTDLPDDRQYMRELTFDDEGNLYVYSPSAVYRMPVGGDALEKLVSFNEVCDLMESRDNLLLCQTGEKIYIYDIEKKSFIEDGVLDNFTKENCGDMGWFGVGYGAYSFLGGENTVYVACGSGLYRHVIGGGVMEQVIDGGLSMLSAPSHGVMSMTVNDKNEFLTAYSDGKIVRAAYDASVPTVPDNMLSVYSLKDDDMVRQTITVYQSEYPDIYIDYQVGMDGGATREDALKKLNTQLLGGSGPDVVILDGMNIGTYVEKGVLMDLTDIVDAADKKDGLYTNLIKNMQTGDNVLAVPTIFSIPVLGGQKDVIDKVTDYKSFADMVEKARVDYPDTSLITGWTAKGVLRQSMAVCAPSWKDSKGALDTGKIKEFLEQTKRIYDAQMKGLSKEYLLMRQQGMDDEAGYQDNKYFTMMSELGYLMEETSFAYGEILTCYGYKGMLSVPRVEGCGDSVFKPWDGQSAGVYHPMSIVGVGAATKFPDEAKQFVGMMLGTSVQGTMEFGLPVNKKAMAAAYEYDESKLSETGAESSMGVSTADGKYFGYDIYPVGKDGVDMLEKWIAGLDTPYLADAVLEDAIYKEGAKYLEGRQGIDETVSAISGSVEIYLYE